MSITPFMACDWPAPANVRAFHTTRAGGVSAPPYDAFNLAHHVGDEPDAVAANRRLLAELLHLPSAPCWLEQVHGTRIVRAGPAAEPVAADGSFTTESGTVCAVLTADCLPVLMCDDAGSRVAAVHAGWRGLAAGVIEAGLAVFPDPRAVHAWIGPAIGPAAFEIGDEPYAALRRHPAAPAAAFTRGPRGRWHAHLALLARRRLEAAGAASVSGDGRCTHDDPERFYSYRRDGVTGRSASLVWLT